MFRIGCVTNQLWKISLQQRRAQQLIEPERESRGFHLRDLSVSAVSRARLIRALGTLRIKESAQLTVTEHTEHMRWLKACVQRCGPTTHWRGTLDCMALILLCFCRALILSLAPLNSGVRLLTFNFEQLQYLSLSDDARLMISWAECFLSTLCRRAAWYLQRGAMYVEWVSSGSVPTLRVRLSRAAEQLIQPDPREPASQDTSWRRKLKAARAGRLIRALGASPYQINRVEYERCKGQRKGILNHHVR